MLSLEAGGQCPGEVLSAQIPARNGAWRWQDPLLTAVLSVSPDRYNDVFHRAI